jgi:signal transduction histidine kinase/GAF domain-containing protein
MYNFLKHKREKERELQIKLAQIIITSIDPEELKNKIVKEIAIGLNAYRCFFIEYDLSTNNFKKVANSFNTQRDSLSMLGLDIETAVPSFALKRKYMKYNLIEDTEMFIKENKLEGSNEDLFFKNYNVKASLSVRLEFGDTFLGILVVEYDHKKPFLEDFDLKYLINIAEHISIALYLSTLYVKEKSEKERERLLRSIITIMTENNDLTQITQKIFEILGKIYDAQTVFINVNKEIFENKSFQKFLYQSNSIDQEKNELIDINIYELPNFDLIKNQIHYIPDTHNFIIQNNLENTVIEEHFQKYNIKSLILLPILHKNLSFGLLIIHFNKPNPITKEDLIFIRTVTDHLAIAVTQFQNFEKQRKTAEREILLRKITESIRTTLDINELKNKIVTEIGQTLNADRCFITEFDSNTDKFLIIKSEYLSSPDITGYYGVDVNEEVPAFTAVLKKGQEILIENTEVFIKDCQTISQIEILALEKHKVKSAFAIPIFYSDQLMGLLTIHYVNKLYGFSEEELNLLRTLTGQIGISIYQAKLYDITQKQTERERLLREIIITVRQLEEHDKIFDYILENLINQFDFDRALHVHYSIEGKMQIKNEKVKDNYELITEQNIPLELNLDEIMLNSQEGMIVRENVASEIKKTIFKDFFDINNIKAFMIYSTESYIYPEQLEKSITSTILMSKTTRLFSSLEVETFKLIIDTTKTVYMEIKQRKETEKIKQTFLATLTHDLRSPINAEQKALEAIIGKKLGTSLDDFSEYLTSIYKTNEELLRIVNNILSVYHYESGHIELKRESVDITNLINDAVKSLIYLAKDQDSEIIEEIEPDLPLIKIDRDEIYRVITNLLNNAIKHNKKGTEIKIKAQKTNDEVIIAISDNGKGIPEEEKSNIFQKYPTKKRKIGTGLGLYLSKQIIDAHKGKIWFETEEKKGTTFYFCLKNI